jgi:hypothetical protein
MMLATAGYIALSASRISVILDANSWRDVIVAPRMASGKDMYIFAFSTKSQIMLTRRTSAVWSRDASGVHCTATARAVRHSARPTNPRSTAARPNALAKGPTATGRPSMATPRIACRSSARSTAGRTTPMWSTRCASGTRAARAPARLSTATCTAAPPSAPPTADRGRSESAASAGCRDAHPARQLAPALQRIRPAAEPISRPGETPGWA